MSSLSLFWKRFRQAGYQGPEDVSWVPTEPGHWTPLTFAMNYSQSHVLALIEAGADLHHPDTFEGKTPLMYSVIKPNKVWFDLLMKKGVDLNILSQEQESALSLSLAPKHEYFSRALLEAGADPNLGDDEMPFRILHLCPQVLTLALDKGLKSEVKHQNWVFGNTVLLHYFYTFKLSSQHVISGFTQKKQKALLDELLARDERFQDKLNKNQNLLHGLTSHTKHLLSQLLEKGFSINQADHLGITPLMKWVAGHPDQGWRALSMTGIKKELKILQRYTPNWKATRKDQANALWLACGEDFTGVNSDFNSHQMQEAFRSHPIFQRCSQKSLTEQRGLYFLVDFLIQQQVPINQATLHGVTPLMMACRYNPFLVPLLLNHGASLEQEDQDGRTALDYFLLGYGNLSDLNTLIVRGARFKKTILDSSEANPLLWEYIRSYRDRIELLPCFQAPCIEMETRRL